MSLCANLRIGFPSYLNALPYILPFLKGEVRADAEFFTAVPSELNTMLREKKIDVALTSSTESFACAHIPGFGIAAKERCLSVNLYTRGPPQKIAVTHHSAASVSLCKILCQQLWSIEPCIIPLDRSLPFSHYQAILLIGDEALQCQSLPGFITTDLAALWYEWMALPFVFALFSVNDGIDPHKMTHFRHALHEALTWSEAHRHEIEQEAIGRHPLSLGLIQHYFSNLIFRLNKNEMEGFNAFQQLSTL